jgi:hypothetical protein
MFLFKWNTSYICAEYLLVTKLWRPDKARFFRSLWSNAVLRGERRNNCYNLLYIQLRRVKNELIIWYLKIKNARWRPKIYRFNFFLCCQFQIASFLIFIILKLSLKIKKELSNLTKAFKSKWKAFWGFCEIILGSCNSFILSKWAFPWIFHKFFQVPAFLKITIILKAFKKFASFFTVSPLHFGMKFSKFTLAGYKVL